MLLAWGGCRLVAVLYHTPTHPLHVGCGVVRCVELTKVMEVCSAVWCGVVWYHIWMVQCLKLEQRAVCTCMLIVLISLH